MIFPTDKILFWYRTGMDSLMAVEIKQALEREFEIILTAPELRTLTFGKLQELTDSIGKGDKLSAKSLDASKSIADVQRNMILRSLGNEKTANEVIIPLNKTDTNKSSDVCALFVAGIEGVASADLAKSCKLIEIPIYALQLNAFSNAKTFPELISSISKVNVFAFISQILHFWLNFTFFSTGCDGFIQWQEAIHFDRTFVWWIYCN